MSPSRRASGRLQWSPGGPRPPRPSQLPATPILRGRSLTEAGKVSEEVRPDLLGGALLTDGTECLWAIFGAWEKGTFCWSAWWTEEPMQSRPQMELDGSGVVGDSKQPRRLEPYLNEGECQDPRPPVNPYWSPTMQQRANLATSGLRGHWDPRPRMALGCILWSTCPCSGRWKGWAVKHWVRVSREESRSVIDLFSGRDEKV